MLNNKSKNDIKDYTARDLMTKDVVILLPQDNLLDAQNRMSRYGIKKIVIIDDNNKRHPVGILSIKGIIKFLILDRIDRDLNEIPIDEAMTKNLITINETKRVIDCAKILDKDSNSTLSSLIIVEDDPTLHKQLESSVNGRNLLSGIITSTDFTRFFSERCIGLASVKDYMSHPVFSISINEKISTAAKLMIEKNVSRLVVTPASRHHNRLLGILSETDISTVTVGLKSKTLRSVSEYMQMMFSSSKKNITNNLHEPTHIRIRDTFTPKPTVIDEDADLAEAAKTMVTQRISGIPVVESASKEGKTKTQLIGIISKTDVVKALTNLE